MEGWGGGWVGMGLFVFFGVGGRVCGCVECTGGSPGELSGSPPPKNLHVVIWAVFVIGPGLF